MFYKSVWEGKRESLSKNEWLARMIEHFLIKKVL